MNSNFYNFPESWLSLLGGCDASGWITAFVAAPKKAVDDLLWDAFYFGPLNLTERDQLLAGWLACLGSSEQFAERLDAELSCWVEKNWGRFDHPVETLVSAWSSLCSVIAFSSRLSEDSQLKNCAAALRARFAERQRFLGSFSSAPAADPLGIYLSVVAEFQGEDRSLATFWHRMCDLPDEVPFYHAQYALTGLRRLKAADPAENGTLRAEVVLGLIRLARAFDRITRERAFPKNIAKATFFRFAGQLAMAYPNSPSWIKHGLAEALQVPDPAQRWLIEAVPPIGEAIRREKNKTARKSPREFRGVEPDPSWSQRAHKLAAHISSGGSDYLPEVQRLLNEQRRYAEATGDTYYIVRTLCNFASRALIRSPQISLTWVNEARQWEPDNAFTWSTAVRVLLRQNMTALALRFAWLAWKRFPDNVVTRNGLAEVLKVARRYDEAEQIFRETIDRFPDNVVARTGLAEVLKVARRYDEAEQIFRETIDRFPDNVVTRAGLAEVLKVARRYDEAEQIFRETIDRFPDNVVTRNGLADTLRRSGRWKDAEVVYRQGIDRGYVNQATFIGLAYLVLRKGEVGHAEALGLLGQALKFDPRNRYLLSLKRDLMTGSEVNLDQHMSEWDKIADAQFDLRALMAEREEELGSNEELALQLVFEHLQPSVRQGALPESPVGPRNRQDMATGEPEDTLPPSGKQRLTSLQPSTTTESELFAQHVCEIEPQTSTPADVIEVAALVAEAYFYRSWARDADDEAATTRYRRAATLLDRAEELSSQDPLVLAERAALKADEGDEPTAFESLTIQLGTHPASVPLLVLKARLQRERARKERSPLNERTLAELCVIPQHLNDLNPALKSLFHFQKGLASLALLDGAVRLNFAAQSFSEFRRSLARRASEQQKEREAARDPRTRSVPRFHEWLQAQTNRRIFATLTEPENVHASDIPTIENALATYRSEALSIEDMLADRLVFATV